MTCKLAKNFECPLSKHECNEHSLLECLQVASILLAKENNELKQKQLKRHSEISLKWRDQAFYQKKKAQKLQKQVSWLSAELYLYKEKEGTNDSK